MVDWTPEDGDRIRVARRVARRGSSCEYPWAGVEVVVNAWLVHRYALIRDRQV